MQLRENDANSTSPEPDAKRRKLRKGTRSCWDCKKRKVKCTFDTASDTVCIACRRRGAPCIGQDQPEEKFQAHAGYNHDLLVERLQRVEQLLEKLAEVGHDVERDAALAGLGLPTHRKSGYFTPSSDHHSLDSFNPPERLQSRTQDQGISDAQLPTPESTAPKPGLTIRMTEECKNISVDLRKAFPSQEDINILCRSDYIATFYCYQIFTRSSDRLEHEAYDVVNELAEIPDPSTTPPVLMAKRMLILALILQYFRCSQTNCLSENPATIANSMVDSAVRLVTTNDQLVGCIEGLECIILEGIFQSNCGNLRRAWISFRKAMVIAQLMKMDLPNPPTVKSLDVNCRLDPKIMWFRIVHMDSYLSLMLGLPHGGQTTNMENPIPGETPSCKIERAHTLIARRIVDRNRRDPLLQNFDATRELDRELLNIAKGLPDKYWLPPNFTNLQPNTGEAFREQMRLRDQLHHYNLVHLVHLPFLLRCDKESEYHMYAKITCINASREILTRFIAFRNFNRVVTQSCRTADFFALMAGMTILLAHIDSHRWQGEDFRAHQRLSDRAMVEQLLESMEVVAKQTSDSLTSKSAEQLRCLLEIESDAARGMGHTAENTVSCLEEHCGELQLSIPYFGIIKIGAGGIKKDWPVQQPPVSVPADAGISDSVHVANHDFPGFGQVPNHNNPSNSLLSVPDEQQLQTPQVALASPDEDLRQQQQQYPGLAAGVNDWVFQGVDAAFFDSLMRGTSDWEQTLQGNVNTS